MKREGKCAEVQDPLHGQPPNTYRSSTDDIVGDQSMGFGETFKTQSTTVLAGSV